MATAMIPLITAGLSALSGLFGNKNKQTQNTNSTLNQRSSSSSNAGTNMSGYSTNISGPQFSGVYQNFLNQLISQYSNINNPVNLRPYAAQQIQGINRASNLSSQATNNIMAARGLSTSPVAATAALNTDANRIAQINNVNASIPLLQRQMQLENLNAGRGMAALLPALSPTVSSTTSNQTGTSWGQENTDTSSVGTGQSTGSTQEGGGLAGLLNILALLSNANSGNNAQSPYGSGLAGLLANLFG